MTKEEWCEIWNIPQESRDAAWQEKLAMDGRTQGGPTVFADLPDFVSPIDGSVVRGRAGMRDHCARHNVVPTADLAGLPPKRVYEPNQSPSSAYREATKRTIAAIMDSRGYK